MSTVRNVTPLSKEQLAEGYFVWLRQDARTIDEEAFERSGIRPEALDHPVLIVDMLSKDHDYIWICWCSGSANDTHLKIHHTPKYDNLPCFECGRLHQQASHTFLPLIWYLNIEKVVERSFMTMISTYIDGILYHNDPKARMCKPTHVFTRRVYEVPVNFLAPLDDRFESDEVSSHSLDTVSLLRVKNKAAMHIDKLRNNSFALGTWHDTDDLSNHKEDLKSKKKVEVLEGRVRELESKVRGLEGKVEGLESKVEKLEAELGEIGKGSCV